MALVLNPATGKYEEDGKGPAPSFGTTAVTLPDGSTALPSDPALALRAGSLRTAFASGAPDPTAVAGTPLVPATAPPPVDPSHAPAAPPSSPPGSTGPDPLKGLRDIGAGQVDRAAAALEAAQAVGPDVSKTSNWSESREKQVRSQGEIAAQGRLGAVIEGGKEVVDKATEIKAQKAEADAAAAQALADQAKAQAAQREAAESEWQRKEEAAAAKVAEERQKFSSMKVTDLFEGREAAGVGAAIMVGIGQFGAALSGGENTALRILDGARARHAQRQQAEIDKQLKVVEMTTGDRDAVTKARAEAAARLHSQQAGILDIMSKQRAAVLAKFGASEERIAGDALKNQLDERAAREALEAEKAGREFVRMHRGGQQTVSNARKNDAMAAAIMAARQGPDQSPDKWSDGQRKADSYLQKAKSEAERLAGMKGYADKDLREIEKWRAKMSSEIGDTTVEKALASARALSGDLFKRLSPEGRQRLNAEMGFVEQTLRPDTGAAITGSEYVTRLVEISAARGDTQEIVAQKGERMVSYLAGMATQTGRPGYWSKELTTMTGGGPAQMPAADVAKLAKFILETDPSDPRVATARQILQARAR